MPGAEEGIGSSGTGTTDGCGPPGGLPEQPVFLTFELSPQPQTNLSLGVGWGG